MKQTTRTHEHAHTQELQICKTSKWNATSSLKEEKINKFLFPFFIVVIYIYQ
jgi:hypothetical protein